MQNCTLKKKVLIGALVSLAQIQSFQRLDKVQYGESSEFTLKRTGYFPWKRDMLIHPRPAFSL